MDQFLFQDLSEEKRVQHLISLTEGAEEKDYSVFLTQEELAVKKSQFATLAIQEARLIDQKKEQIVEHNLPKAFKIFLPIFKGMPQVTIEVEILVNKSLDITLYSTELIQLTDELKDKYVTEVVSEIIKMAPGLAIIYQ